MDKILEHCLVKRGRKNKVEDLNSVGYGAQHNMWQDDVETCGISVSAYWSGKPEAERLGVMLSSQCKRKVTALVP